MTLQYNVVFGNRNSKSSHTTAKPTPSKYHAPLRAIWWNPLWTLKTLFWYQFCTVRSSTVGVVSLPNLSNLASKWWTWNTSSASISWQWILRWHGGVDAASVYNQVEDETKQVTLWSIVLRLPLWHSVLSTVIGQAVNHDILYPTFPTLGFPTASYY